MTEEKIPVPNYERAAAHLRRPFAPEAIKFRPAPGKLILAYIDARVVIERLNAVIPGWSSRFEPFPGGKQIICHLTLPAQNQYGQITRSDVGTQATGDRVDPVKAGYSDALKRAAVHFGVGVSVYALKQIYISDLPGGSTREVGQKKNLVLTDKGVTTLRKGYRKWLNGPGKHFGDVLDHGDVEGAIGDPEVAPPDAGGEPVEQPSLETEAAIQEAKDFYEARVDKRKLSKAKANAQIRAASGSREELAVLCKSWEEFTK